MEAGYEPFSKSADLIPVVAVARPRILTRCIARPLLSRQGADAGELNIRRMIEPVRPVALYPGFKILHVVLRPRPSATAWLSSDRE